MDIKQIVASVVETIIKVAVVVFLVMFVYDKAMQAYDYGYRVFAEEPVTTGDGRTISISVSAGDSARDIAKNLEEKGLIRDANLFFIQELLSEYHGQIKPGIYDLNTSMSSDEMMAIMSAETDEEQSGASTDNVPISETETEGTDEAENGEEGTEAEQPDETGESGTEG